MTTNENANEIVTNFNGIDICAFFSQRRPSAIGIGYCRLSRVFEHLCIELRTPQWIIKWRCSSSKHHRSQLARFGHFLNEKIPWRCYRTAASAIASPVFAILLRSIVGQNTNQLTSALLAIHHNRIATVVVATWTNRFATGRMAKLHQDLWRTQLRFHFWWVSIKFLVSFQVFSSNSNCNTFCVGE